MKFIKKGKKITHFMLMKQLELLFIKRFDSIMAILVNPIFLASVASAMLAKGLSAPQLSKYFVILLLGLDI